MDFDARGKAIKIYVVCNCEYFPVTKRRTTEDFNLNYVPGIWLYLAHLLFDAFN